MRPMFTRCITRPASVLLAGSLVLAASCSRSHTITTSNGTATFREKGKDAGTLTVTGKDGKTATLAFNDAKLPGDYPKDVPVYSGAKVVMSQSASDKNARSLLLQTGDDAGTVVGFYKKGLDDNGWKTESTMNTGQVTMFTASKENRQMTLQITDDGSRRSIMQVVAEK